MYGKEDRARGGSLGMRRTGQGGGAGDHVGRECREISMRGKGMRPAMDRERLEKSRPRASGMGRVQTAWRRAELPGPALAGCGACMATNMFLVSLKMWTMWAAPAQ